jgi:hypothetical protein
MYHLKKMYDQQFRLILARDHRRSWTTIECQLWLQFAATGGHSVTQNTPRMSYTVNRPCYDYNFKSYCTCINCIYNHTCIRCGKFHPSVYCQQLFNTFRKPGSYRVRPPNIAHRYSPNMRMENRLYNQLTAIIIPRELGKILILVLGQTLPDFLDSNSVYTNYKIKMFLK